MKRYEEAPDYKYEEARLRELYELEILDTGREDRFDKLTRVAANLFGTEFVLITLMDANKQWFKSCIGTDTEINERNLSFCTHAIYQNSLLIINDTLKDLNFLIIPWSLMNQKFAFTPTLY